MVGKEYAKEAGLDARKAHIICGMNHDTRERTLLKDGIRIGAAKNLRVNEQGLLVGDLYFDDSPECTVEVVVNPGEFFQWVDAPDEPHIIPNNPQARAVVLGALARCEESSPE